MFGLVMLWSASALSANVNTAVPDNPQVILAAGSEGGISLTEVLELEPGHLLALGAGVATGAVLIGPYLAIGELVGVAIGIISAELFYRSDLWPLDKPRGWFD
jgi:hypothetical protein